MSGNWNLITFLPKLFLFWSFSLAKRDLISDLDRFSVVPCWSFLVFDLLWLRCSWLRFSLYCMLYIVFCIPFWVSHFTSLVLVKYSGYRLFSLLCGASVFASMVCFLKFGADSIFSLSQKWWPLYVVIC